MRLYDFIIVLKIIEAYSASKISVLSDDEHLAIAVANIIEKCSLSSERWSELLVIPDQSNDEILKKIHHDSKTSNLILFLNSTENIDHSNNSVEMPRNKPTSLIITIKNLKHLDSIIKFLEIDIHKNWRPESYLFIILETNCDVAECNKIFKVIWDYWILDAVIMCSFNDPANRNQSEIELYTFNPYSADHSQKWETIIHEIVEVSIYTGNFNHSWYIFKQTFNGIRSFKDCGDIFFDKTLNLDGYVIPISFSYPEFLLDTTIASAAKTLVTDSRTLKTISKKLQFNVTQVVNHDLDVNGGPHANGSYSGMMADIHKGRSHLGPTMRGMRIYPGLGMTYPHDTSSACFASRIIGIRPQWTNFNFARHIWIGFGLCILSFTLFFYMQNNSYGILSAFLESLRLIIGTSVIHTSTVFKYRIILGSIFLVVLVFDGTIKGRFISILTAVRPYPNLDTMAQLKEQNMDLYGHEAFKQIIMDPELKARLKIGSNVPECLAALVDRQQICFSDCQSLQLLTLNSTIIHTCSTPFWTTYVTFLTTIHWPMTNRYSFEVKKLVESGIFRKWMLNMKRKIEVDGWKVKRVAELAYIKPAKLNDLLPAFMLLFVGLSIALIALVCEIISHEYLNR